MHHSSSSSAIIYSKFSYTYSDSSSDSHTHVDVCQIFGCGNRDAAQHQDDCSQRQRREVVSQQVGVAAAGRAGGRKLDAATTTTVPLHCAAPPLGSRWRTRIGGDRGPDDPKPPPPPPPQRKGERAREGLGGSHVDRRYRRYCEQMRALSGGFEAVAGERAAAAYTALASRTISRHFRSLRDGIVAQLQAARKALGEKDVAVPGMTRGDTPRLRVLDQCIRQQKALTQAGMLESHPWRPQRGLPERAVTILRAWLFEHFLHPYPSDVDKHILARQTGLSRSQVSNWFINARVRLWKPMVEEMYVEEMKDGSIQHQDGGGGDHHQQRSVADPNNPSSSHASGAHEEAGDRDGRGDNGVDRKPTRAQLLHDAGSLASVVNIGGGGGPSRVAGVPRLGDNFGIMDHLDFDSPYDHQQQGGFGGVSLTLGLQQHDSHDGGGGGGGGVNIAFGAPPPPPAAHHGAGYLFAAAGGQHHQMDGHHHHVQFGAGSIDGEGPHGGQEHYRSQLGAGFHLLRDLAG
ncbi:hypothetical protein U9M48_005923 [Paspalum notatum var. saurae]|uniref:Homeobox domain-containing protein n=1 Tax=Paspalum notatum var. saurae TaxID=547442 RepID=A0AAQ3PR52_PASNO